MHGDLSTGPLDRETRSTYNLTITATDHGKPPLTATAFVIVTVLDENDNSPLFDEQVIVSWIKNKKQKLKVGFGLEEVMQHVPQTACKTKEWFPVEITDH